MPSSAQREIVHEGDAAALDAYVDAHRGDLEREAADIRSRARIEMSRLAANTLPQTNREWIAYLEEHEESFRTRLQTGSSQRKVLNTRLQVSQEDWPDGPRLNPVKVAVGGAPWLDLLKRAKAGVKCLEILHPVQDKLVLFTCSVLGECWCFPLQEVTNRIFCAAHANSLCDVLRPVLPFLNDLGLPAEELQAHAHELVVQVTQCTADCVYLRILEAHAVQAPARAARAEQGQDAEGTEERELLQSDSSCTSCWSGSDSAEEAWPWDL